MADNENEKPGRHLLTESDFVDWETPEGDVLSVPKHWGKDQLPAGSTKKSRRSSTSSSSSASTPDPNAEPAGNASTEAWAKYAVEVKGAKPEDLVDEKGEPLGRDELRAKFGSTPS